MIFTFLIGIITSRISMISYDEGPSKNITRLVDTAIKLEIPVVFHLDPFHDSFNKSVVDYLIYSGFEVGIAITEQINENKEDIKKVLMKYEEEFIKKSEYVPVLLRLPTVGILSEEAYSVAESMGYIVTTPNFDSEDDQKSDIKPFLAHALHEESSEKLSFVFRDRYSTSVDLLEELVFILRKKGYKIVPACEYLNKETKLIPVDKDNIRKDNNKDNIRKDNNKDNKDSENPIYLTKFEIIGDSIPTGIRLYTTKDGILIKEIKLPYSTFNKLVIRQFLKEEINRKEEIDLMYEEIINKCADDEEECKAHADNGDETLWNISIIALSSLLLM